MDVYYAIWANLSMLPLIVRAALVLAVVVLFVWLLVRLALFRLLALLLRAAGTLVKLLCLLGQKLLGLIMRGSSERYGACYNRLAGLTGKWNERLLHWSKRMSGKHKSHLGHVFFAYVILIFLIGLPNLLGSVISEEYISYFSAAADLYQRLEAPALERAASYSPLFAISHGGSAENPPSGETPGSEVWLPLSERGQGGSNLRAGPGKENQVVDTISGDEQVLYLYEQSNGWIHVCTADGIEGWIYNSLLTGVPEDASE